MPRNSQIISDSHAPITNLHNKDYNCVPVSAFLANVVPSWLMQSFYDLQQMSSLTSHIGEINGGEKDRSVNNTGIAW